MPSDPNEPIAAYVRTALRVACASMPHLAGLAAAVRIHVDSRIPTAAITATGRLLVNPAWFVELGLQEAAFIVAHELLHLCLRSHERCVGTDAKVFNWAHDYIINDMLKHHLGCPIPANGLDYPGAREFSAEQIVNKIRNGAIPGPKRRKVPRSTVSIELEKAGLLPPSDADPDSDNDGDVLTKERERELFPDTDVHSDEELRHRVTNVAAKSVSLGVLKDRLDRIESGRGADVSGGFDDTPELLKSFYRPPWEMALQQWLEAIAPGPRSFARPSRRAGTRTDIVLPGRKREGWALHIVLDTSGSMVAEIPRVLGTIAAFCESVGVAQIHVLQCDVRVTHDDWLDPEELANFSVSGGGGSNMTPAMLQLAEDPDVQAAVVITDGEIDFPREPMPYQVLWALTSSGTFDPGYGIRLHIPPR
jgi:predicted metal-dependent peptidase